MKSVNRCFLTGTISKDPETRKLSNGGSVCSSELTYTIGSQNGDKENYVSIESWGQLAPELAALHQGEQVLVEGTLIRQAWKSKKDDSWVSKHTIRLATIQPLGVQSKDPDVDSPEPQEAAEASDVPF